MPLVRKIKNLYLGLLSLLIGMRVTIKNFFAPRVTLHYPYEKHPMKTNFRGMVDLKPQDCIVCYQCIKICPSAALELAHQQILVDNKKKNVISKFTYNPELCCFCGLCDEICPTDAIFMNKLYEISAFSHDQIMNIDLMDPEKYKILNPNYQLPDEIQKNDKRTVGKVIKPATTPTGAVNTSV